MIKRQYERYHNSKSYFVNFLEDLDTPDHVPTALKPWRATMHKSKSPYKYNIKFHDPMLYSLFVMRWS